MSKTKISASIALQELQSLQAMIHHRLVNNELLKFDGAESKEYTFLDNINLRINESIRLFQILINDEVWQDDGQVPLNKKASEMSRDEIIEYIEARRPFQKPKGGDQYKIKNNLKLERLTENISKVIVSPLHLDPIEIAKVQAIVRRTALQSLLERLSESELNALKIKVLGLKGQDKND